MTKLEDARKTINEVDREMARLFDRRMEAVRTVAEYKKENGIPVLDKTREEEVLRRNSEYVDDPELKAYYVSFLKHNMELSRNFQHRLLQGMRVAYSGVPGAFANIAAKRIFPDGIAVSYSDFKSAYDSVVAGECDCAVLPVENSFAGDVAQVMDLAFFGPLCINGMYDLRVVQNLIGTYDADVRDVKKVISHKQALDQCAEYIRDHGFERESVGNTAVAAKIVSETGDKSLAAIAAKETAELYGLRVLEKNINESAQNTTRFAVFTRAKKAPSASDRHFILLFTVKNEAGSLGRVVTAIGENGFNLRALKSRPTKDLIWEYYFYAEGEGNIYDERGKKLAAELEKHCSTYKIIASFEKEEQIKD